jgi:hypothetical protein
MKLKRGEDIMNLVPRQDQVNHTDYEYLRDVIIAVLDSPDEDIAEVEILANAILDMIQQLADGDLNATHYLYEQAINIRSRAIALLSEWLPDESDEEPNYSDLPI